MKSLKSPIFLTGEKIYLEPLSHRHRSARYLQWLNDPEVCRDNSHAVFPYSEKEMKTYLEKTAHSKNGFFFAIRLKKNNQHVGNVSLDDISWVNRSAEISILIGERKVWGKGVGFEACRIVMDYALNRLNLHRVRMGMTTRNQAMIRIAKKLKMLQEGVLRQALFKEGQFLDLTLWAVINPKH